MIYSSAFLEFRYGAAAALSVLMFLFMVVFAMIYLRKMKAKEVDE